MKAILARQWNRAFSLLRYEPIVAKVVGTDHEDIYVRPGDPIGWRNMCEMATYALCGLDPLAGDEIGPVTAVEAFIIPRAGMTNELRQMIKNAQQKGGDNHNGVHYQD